MLQELSWCTVEELEGVSISMLVQQTIFACLQIQSIPCAIELECRATCMSMELSIKIHCKDHMITMFPALCVLCQDVRWS